MKRNFDLGMGCLGNGITLYNRAVERHGDYEHIGHISPAGRLTLYVKPESIPGADLLRIETECERMEAQARRALDLDFAADPTRTYYRMLDTLPTDKLLDFIHAFRSEPLEIKYVNLIPLYLSVN